MPAYNTKRGGRGYNNIFSQFIVVYNCWHEMLWLVLNKSGVSGGLKWKWCYSNHNRSCQQLWRILFSNIIQFVWEEERNENIMDWKRFFKEYFIYTPFGSLIWWIGMTIICPLEPGKWMKKNKINKINRIFKRYYNYSLIWEFNRKQ